MSRTSSRNGQPILSRAEDGPTIAPTTAPMTAPRRAEDVGDRAQHASGVKAQRAAQRKGGEGSSLAAVKVKPVRSSVNGNAGFRNTLSTTVQGGQGTNPAESVAARGPRRASTVASDDLFATRRPVAGEPSAGSEPGRRSRGSRAGGPLRNEIVLVTPERLIPPGRHGGAQSALHISIRITIRHAILPELCTSPAQHIV